MMSPDRLATELTRRLDGPHADEHTAGTARLAAEAVRFLNYATGHHAGQGLTYPATAYTVTGQLAGAAYGLPQTCRQLAAWLDAEHAAGRLADDHRRPVGELTTTARSYLAEAAQLADSLGRALSEAQSAISGLYRPGR